jgi:hypothetical protein
MTRCCLSNFVNKPENLASENILEKIIAARKL